MQTIERLKNLRKAIGEHLEQGIVPFWLARARDDRYGGYLTNFDEQGRAQEMPEKYLNTQCRLLWTFSQLARKYPGTPGCDELARWGFDFIVAHCWDPHYGGFYWKVKRNGSLADDAKIVYGESFAIYAFNEPRYLEAFETLWRFVQAHMIIAGVGEWRTLLDRAGNPIDLNIGNPWKVSYHTGRAMVECVERLDRLIAREK